MSPRKKAAKKGAKKATETTPADAPVENGGAPAGLWTATLRRPGRPGWS